MKNIGIHTVTHSKGYVTCITYLHYLHSIYHICALVCLQPEAQGNPTVPQLVPQSVRAVVMRHHIQEELLSVHLFKMKVHMNINAPDVKSFRNLFMFYALAHPGI